MPEYRALLEEIEEQVDILMKEDDFLSVLEKNAVIRAAFATIKSISTDEGYRRLYEAKLKQQRDIWAIQDEVKERGIEKGVKEMLALWKKGVSLEEAEALWNAKH